jgi:Kef-type K+ transport system membrane component KefB
MISSLQEATANLYLTPLLLLGLIIFIGFYFGKSMKFIKLPSIIGFMIIGVILGPSLFNFLSEEIQTQLSFITDLALSFVALSIGLELSGQSLKQQGKGIITVIFAESFLAFILVSLLLYLLTGDLALSILFGAIAPASAPAGTVAIIQEYKAKGPLTKALYAVVGFDDGLGIIIFGFAAAFAKSILSTELGLESPGFLALIGTPLLEVGLSVVVGAAMAFLFVILVKKLKNSRDIFILLVASVFITAGLCQVLHISVILTNMIVGIIMVNTQKHVLLEQIHRELSNFMPLLFILFFVLAGANLHISALPELGLVGLVYIFGRSAGLVTGASLGSALGKLDPMIRKYLGMGILSQAGVAIGLSLIIKQELLEFGSHGIAIGNTIITTVTATSIFFEIIGPILTKIGLQKAGEISVPIKSPKQGKNKS